MNDILVNYFIESETIKDNIKGFLFNLLIVSLTEKLSYQNADKYIENC